MTALKAVDAARVLRNGVILAALGYQLAAVFYSIHGALEFYYFHLGLVLAIASLVLIHDELAGPRSRVRLLKIAALVIVLATATASSAYLHLFVGEIEFRQPFITEPDFVAGAGLIAAVVVLIYLVWGAILAGLIVLSILYFTFGDVVPGALHYDSPERELIMSYLAGMGGARGVLWGVPLSANTIFLIIVFGGLLKGTRILEMFNEVGKLMLTFSRAGICYSSIFASSAIGMVTGQAVANIALSGSVTIPSMKQRGLSGTQAGAIEVVSSIGSQLIPPIMGLGGFLMAVNLGVPYVEIATAAVVPALLFIATLVIAVFFLAAASPTLHRQREPVDVNSILWILPSFLASFLTLLVLLYLRFSAGYAAFWAIVLLTGLSFVRPARYRPSLADLWSGTSYGVIAAVHLGLILAGIGILVQVLITTGAGFEFGRAIMVAAAGSVTLALIYGMGLSMIIGLGLPTPAAYALIAITMIPFLIDQGVPALSAHFFGFYFAIFSAVTPPVAVGIMAATRISGASFYGTVVQSCRICATALLIPYTFVAYPSILAFPAIGTDAVLACLALMGATVMWGAAIYGVLVRQLHAWERAVLSLGPVSFVLFLATRQPVIAVGIIAVAVLLVGAAIVADRRSKENEAAEPSNFLRQPATASGPTQPSTKERS